MTNKRLLKEIQRLIFQQNSKENILDNDYLVHFDEANINTIYTIIKCPYDSVYRHKFIRLNFEIPSNYPHSPPKVTFVNYDGVRIHPNMYEDGKCCSTILNTWPSDNEKWTSSMGIETVLLAFLSFLDNDPYTYEPGGRDDPTYTDFVKYQSWKTCLIKYLDVNRQKLFSEYIEQYMLKNVGEIFDDLEELSCDYPPGMYQTRCFNIGLYSLNYNIIIENIENIYRFITFKNNNVVPINNLNQTTEIVNFDNFGNFDCDICFDTTKHKKCTTLSCNHKFHNICLSKHIKENGKICSLCRKEISEEPITTPVTPPGLYVINPFTKRKIKINGKLYKELINEGVEF